MKTLRFIALTLAFILLGVVFPSCDKDDKASTAFSGEAELYVWKHQSEPYECITRFDEHTFAVQILSHNNHTFDIDFDSYVMGVSWNNFNGDVNLTYHITGVVYDGNGNEVRRKTVSPTNRRIGRYNDGTAEFTGTYDFQIEAYAGETIRFGVSVSCEGTVTKKCEGIANNVKISFSETVQSGTMEFDGDVR